mmetsp:Transcript_164/g.429  ORF Transcript_164/g.429 Transcript_164/m.429 type:complete len:295 (+) Transcript_164:350-1234(+)
MRPTLARSASSALADAASSSPSSLRRSSRCPPRWASTSWYFVSRCCERARSVESSEVSVASWLSSTVATARSWASDDAHVSSQSAPLGCPSTTSGCSSVCTTCRLAAFARPPRAAPVTRQPTPRRASAAARHPTTVAVGHLSWARRWPSRPGSDGSAPCTCASAEAAFACGIAGVWCAAMPAGACCAAMPRSGVYSLGWRGATGASRRSSGRISSFILLSAAWTSSVVRLPGSARRRARRSDSISASFADTEAFGDISFCSFRISACIDCNFDCISAFSLDSRCIWDCIDCSAS